jgi:hypothetical protein
MSIYGDLVDALESTPRMPRDAGAVGLAKAYAGLLDDCFDALANDDATEDPAEHARKVLEISRIGARLEAMLDRLGMAPGARPAVPNGRGGTGGDPASSALDALRSDAAAGAPSTGIDYAAAVDPSVTEADAED